MPVFFEPLGSRNQNDEAILPEAPWSDGPGVYSPHIYTGWFSIPSQNNWASEDVTALAPSMTAAAKEASTWGTPLFVTEFGCDYTLDQGPKWMQAELDLQDEHLASSTAWSWEPGTWGITNSDGTYKQDIVRIVSRPYPRAVAGDLVTIEHPSAETTLVHYRATAQTGSLPIEVSASGDHFKDYSFQCDSAPATATRTLSTAVIQCPATAGDHTLSIVGVPLN
jgi:hypothetical protein